jgi:hypothetical protein
MNELPKNWLTEMPFDYEFKYYILLAQIKRLKESILEHKLESTLEDIESSLVILYDIKYAKDGIENKDSKIIGIDFDNMEIEFDYPEDNFTVESMYELCDVAIGLYEGLHSDLRKSWRIVSKKLKLSNLTIGSIKNNGFLYIRNKGKLLKYSISIPLPFNTTWKDVRVRYIDKIPDDLSELSIFIKENNDGLRHYLCESIDDIPLNDCLIPVIKSVLYKNLI